MFLFLKLPSAWWCGVRLKEISNTQATVTVKHRWFNQNPFNSLYFAVQAMAAELSTGALVMQTIRAQDKNVSMLVASNKSTFSKKAKGRITFTCTDGNKILTAISETIRTGEGQTVWMQSIGLNEDGQQVSVFDFEWTVKVKS